MSVVQLLGVAIVLAVVAVLVSAAVGGLWLVAIGWLVGRERPRGARRGRR